jgi:hypothetical protein
MDYSPREPFADWPIQLFDPRFGFAWYTEPCVFVDQIVYPQGTRDVAEALQDTIEHVLEREREAIAKHGGLLAIHDWRLVTGYTSEARITFLDRMRKRKKGYLRHVVAVMQDTPLLKMAAQTANVVMALGAGGRLHVTVDARVALVRNGVVPPTKTGWR